jgi:hypothetical protein
MIEHFIEEFTTTFNRLHNAICRELCEDDRFQGRPNKC